VFTIRPAATMAVTLLAGLALTACSSSSHPSTSSSGSTAKSLRKDIKQVGQCLSSHGADPSGLTGLLTGTPITVTGTQLTRLRSASTACDSSLPASLKQRLATTITCLDRSGSHLDAGAPLRSLFTLDLSSPKVTAEVKACAPALAARSPKSKRS
jgi:hypothetical protein